LSGLWLADSIPGMTANWGKHDHTVLVLQGGGALELLNHALAPVASLPVREVFSGVHILSDLTLGLGTVVHDYLRTERTPYATAR
jgi:hypothetical protein